MHKRFSSFLFILVLLAWSFAACIPNSKMVKRYSSGTATLTPFAKKATYTITSTPEKNPDQSLQLNPTSTAAIETVSSEESTQVTTTLEPSLTLTPTNTPGINSPTIPPPLTTATPSATTKPLQPTSTTGPGQSTATTIPIQSTTTAIPIQSTATATLSNPSHTPNQPAATQTPELPTATSNPPPTSTPAGCVFTGNAAYENQVVTLINKERTDRGLPALSNNSSLRLAARRHSEDMACNDFFSHTGSDGSTLGSRLIAAGYSYSWAAENIAASSSSYFSAQSVVTMWMNSSGHKANILSENVTQIGVGFRYAGDSNSHDYDAYYTADFGRP